MSQNTFTNLGRIVWYPTWGSFGALGFCDAIDPTGLKILKDPIKVGTYGKTKLGDRFLGVEGSIKITCREITQALVLALMPWNGGTVPGSGISIAPAFNVDLYTYAQTLRLHPLGAGDDSLDLVFAAAVPMMATTLKRDGQKDDEWMIEFEIYPSRTNLISTPSVAAYGTAGGA